jgi:hypothetical protein
VTGGYHGSRNRQNSPVLEHAACLIQSKPVNGPLVKLPIPAKHEFGKLIAFDFDVKFHHFFHD